MQKAASNIDTATSDRLFRTIRIRLSAPPTWSKRLGGMPHVSRTQREMGPKAARQ